MTDQKREKHPKSPSKANDKPGPRLMTKIFAECGLELSEAELDMFWRFHELLRSRKDEADLTRLHNFESIVLRHYVDSAVIAEMADLPAPLLDIGTGAGFPGIPIKILRPDLHIILAESRAKKLEFLEEAIQTLGLTGIEIYPHKVTGTYDRPVGGIITRDFEAIEKTLDRVSGFLLSGGLIFFMKGPSADKEINEAEEKWQKEYSIVDDVAYTLGETSHNRRLVVYERTGAGPIMRLSRREPRSTEIASQKNAQFKIWQKLKDGRGVKKHGLAIMSGPKQVAEMLADFPEKCAALLDVRENDGEYPEHVRLFRLRPELFRELDWFGAGGPLLVVKADQPAEWNGTLKPGCTLFMPFQDPANVGAVLRTAAAFGADVVLLEEAAHPYHPKSLRSAGPNAFRVNLYTGPPIRDLATLEIPLLVLGMDGENLAGFDFPESFGLIPGVEGPGLPEELRRLTTLSIPMETGVESLNAAMAAGIALYEWKRK